MVLEVQLPAALRGAKRLLAIVRGLRAKAGLPWLAAAGTGAVVRCKVDGLGVQEGRPESRRVAGFSDIAAQFAALPPAAVHAVAAFFVVACCCGVLECRRRSRTARLRRAAGEKQTLIHGGIALPVAKPTPRTAVRAPKARSKKKARARDAFDEDDDGMDGMSGGGV